jgi:5'-3' exonuclease
MKTALIDLSAIFWRNWHSTADEELSKAGRKTLALIKSLYAPFDEVKICVDSPPYKRKEIFPEYKHGREHPKAALEELDKCKRAIAKDGWPILSCQGAEADDVIATYVMDHEQDEITVYGTDKDLLQIEAPNWTLFDPFTGEEKTAQNKLGVEPHQVVDYLAMVGDTSDNIPGVKGIGAKTAASLLGEHDNMKGIVNAACDMMLKPKQNEVFGRDGDWKKIELAIKLIELDYHCEIVEEKMEEREEAVDIVEMELPGQSETVDTSMVVHKEPAQIVRADRDYRTELEPGSWEDAFRIATGLHQSGLYDAAHRNAQSIMAIIMRGRSMGLDATTALDSMHIIKGRPTMSAQLIIARIMASPQCEYFICTEATDEQAIWKTKRRGHPEESVKKFTAEDAKRMGLSNKDNYRKQPATMNQWRAGTGLGRMVYPDVVLGVYATEEMD